MYSIRKRNSCVKAAQLSRNGFHYTLSGSYAWNCWCQKLQKARVVKGAVLTNTMEKNSIKIIRKATEESMLFSSISNWILKFFVVSRYVNTKKQQLWYNYYWLQRYYNSKLYIHQETKFFLQKGIPVWHWLPVYPLRQLHLKLLMPSTQEPPFWQVWFTQSLLSVKLIRLKLFPYKTW